MPFQIPTDLRSLSSAINGRLSEGPVTDAGKLRASRNAIRHGMLSRCLVLEDESPEVFDQLLAQHVDRLQPADDLEFAIVEEMTASMWRLRRSWAIETGMLDSAAAAPDAPTDPVARIASAFTARAETPALPLAHRYETRLHMMYQRALHNLLLLRATVPVQPNDEPISILKALPAPVEAPPAHEPDRFPNEPTFHRE